MKKILLSLMAVIALSANAQNDANITNTAYGYTSMMNGFGAAKN